MCYLNLNGIRRLTKWLQSSFPSPKQSSVWKTLVTALTTYALASVKLGRVKEAKAIFEDVLATETRVFGQEHPYTQEILGQMRTYGFAEPSG